jgi:ferric-dicitrate binding protein FerR (iron transport regulator)
MKPEDLIAWLDGQASPEEAEAVDSELERHPELMDTVAAFCRQRLMLAELTREPARAEAPARPEAAAAGRAKTVRRLGRSTRRAVPHLRRKSWTAYIFAAAAALAAGIILVVALGRDRQPETPQAVSQPGAPAGPSEKLPVPAAVEQPQRNRTPENPKETPAAPNLAQTPETHAVETPHGTETPEVAHIQTPPEPPKRPEPDQRPSGQIARLASAGAAYARGSQGAWERSAKGVSLFPGDRIDTQSGTAQIDMDYAVVAVNSHTTLRLCDGRRGEASFPVVDLAAGEIFVDDRGGKVHVLTPDGLCSPAGTRYSVRAADGVTAVVVEDGTVAAQSIDTAPTEASTAARIDLAGFTWAGQSVQVDADRRMVMRKGAAATEPERADTKVALRWMHPIEWVKMPPAAPKAGEQTATAQTVARLQPKPGSTVWLKAGEYRPDCLTGKGAAGSPVIYRAMPGEKVLFKSGLVLKGEHVWLWGAVISGKDAVVDVREGTGLRLINCVIAQNKDVSLRKDVSDAEVYGCLIHRNALSGLVVQNATGAPWKWIVDNVVFENGASGISAYGSANFDQERLHVEGNISFANGFDSSGRLHGFAQIVIGREPPGATRAVRVVDNCTWLPGDDRLADGKQPSHGMFLGWTSLANEDLTCTGNFLSGGQYPLFVSTWKGRVDVSRNVLAGGGKLWVGSAPMDDVRENREIAAPAGSRVVRRVNRYEPSRVHLAVYNFDKADKVAVDLSEILKPGSSYRLISVYDAALDPVKAAAAAPAAYQGGTIDIPMKTGQAGRNRWEPDFGAFLLLREYAPKEDLDLVSKMRSAWTDK